MEPTISYSDLVNCSYCQWYPKFEKITLESEIIPLPEEVLSYLLDPGTIVLPADCGISQNCSLTGKASTSASSSCDDDDFNDDEDDSTSATTHNLKEFTEKLREAIERLGGQVYPKLNWTAPKDACWMTVTSSLKCESPADIYLLLKTSDIVETDIVSPYKDCVGDDKITTPVKPCLILKKWLDINPSNEFRCFVVKKKFVGVCPRDISQYYPCLGVERSSIVSDITTFWREQIENRFPLNNYVFDVVRKGKDKVMLLDVSPLTKSRTQPLLFSWEELLKIMCLPPPVSLRINGENSRLELEICENMQNLNMYSGDVDTNRIIDETEDLFDSQGDPEFRYINEETGVQPTDSGRIGIPEELKHFGCTSDSQELIKLMRNTERDDSSDDCSDSDQ